MVSSISFYKQSPKMEFVHTHVSMDFFLKKQFFLNKKNHFMTNDFSYKYFLIWSGRQDLNLRPHAPKARTLAN